MFSSLPRIARSFAAVVVSSLALGACADSTSPTLNSGYITSAAAVASPAVLDGAMFEDFKLLYPKLSTQVPAATTRGDTTIQSFSVTPKTGKLIYFGKKSGHTIAIPANTLCDPNKNAYGPTEWMKPCILATSSITFEVRTWNDAKGQPHAEFSPNIRFNPSAPDPVRLYFADNDLSDFSRVHIPFCDSSNRCIDESITDSELTTHAAPHPKGGYWIYRTLRHFSGYNVTAF
ncbi:MAG: hypothetical protein IT360_19035 [Gemmatimonadaceae bacterium]|nr:hypothetical protein [Gemmatimonadaceae bacterium]